MPFGQRHHETMMVVNGCAGLSSGLLIAMYSNPCGVTCNSPYFPGEVQRDFPAPQTGGLHGQFSSWILQQELHPPAGGGI